MELQVAVLFRNYLKEGRKEVVAYINHCFLVLIPKVSRPESLHQYFWPTGLCNVIFKILTKILKSQLVSSEQSSFLSSRHRAGSWRFIFDGCSEGNLGSVGAWILGFRQMILESGSTSVINLVNQETDRAYAGFIIIARVRELLGREWVGPSSSYLLGS